MNVLSARCLAFALASLATILAPAAIAAGKSKTIMDLTHEDVERIGMQEIRASRYEFSHEKWKDKIAFLEGRGLLVPALPGDGGFGANTRLSFGASTVAELEVVIGNHNESESFLFVLTDGDGTEVSWTLPLGGKPIGQKVSFLVGLNTPDATNNSGKKPGFDATKVKRWEFKGNGQPDKIDVVFARIGAVPPEKPSAK